jgi:hypothetical protein
MKKQLKTKTGKEKFLVKGKQDSRPTGSYWDSTSVIDIQFVVEEDKGTILGNTDLYEEMENFIATAPKADSRSKEDKIKEGKSLTEKTYASFNQAQHSVEGTFANYAVHLGKVLNALKGLVEKGWEAWAAKNLSFMSESNRQVFMRLADTPRIEEYCYLGKERCLHLISVTKGSKSKNPIGDFLTGFKLDFDPKGEPKPLLAEFKNKVDAAIFVAKARNHGVKVDPEGIRKLLEIGVKVDNQTLRNLAMVQKTGGDSEKYLETLYLNRGQEEEFLEPEKRIEGFKKLVVRLKSTIDSILDAPELLGSVDEATIQSLEEKLSALKAKVVQK